MYRLTWDGPDARWKTLRPEGPPQKQRVYRWENKWGFLSRGQWYAESRTPVFHDTVGETRYLLETVEPVANDAPPYSVDDLWEEDVVPLNCGSSANGSYAGHSMSLLGTKEALDTFFVKHGIVLPPEIRVRLGKRE
jgi:hypothetical protein